MSEIRAGEPISLGCDHTETDQSGFDSPAVVAEPRPGRVKRAVALLGLPELALAGAVSMWSIQFIWLSRLRYDRHGTFGFDLGIYDQGVWLLSRFRDPFVTIRGLELFGHHANLFLLMLVPFYWLGAGPVFLLVVQVLAQASGAVGLYLLGRDLLSRWCGVGIAIAFLLNPTNQWLVWEFFHPDAVAIGPLLLAYWAARSKRWPVFWAAFVLALACKEDVALSLVVLGLLLVLSGERRRGLLISAVSIVWFFIATRAVIPFANGVGPFYDTFFGRLGNSPAAVVTNSVRHPTTTWRLVSADDAKAWYWKMVAPWALLPLFDLRVLALAAPMVFIDVLTMYPFTRNFEYHYSALVLVGCAIATVEAIAWIARRAKHPGGTRTVLVIIVVGAALLSSVSWGPSPISRRYRLGEWPLLPDTRGAAKSEAIRRVPPQASLSVSYNLDTHLTHRPKIYEFPVPWCNVNWGVRGEHLDNPDDVQWLLIDTQRVDNPRDEGLYKDLLSSEFRVQFERDGIILAMRVAPPVIPARGNPAKRKCFDR